MTRSSRRPLLAGLLLLPLLAACSTATGLGSTTPVSVSSTGASSSGMPVKAFTSPAFGYRVQYPATWTPIPAPSGSPSAGSTEVRHDRFQAPDSTKAVDIWVQDIPNGMTQDQWWKEYIPTDAPLMKCFPPRAAWQPVVIGGLPGGQHGGLTGCSFTEGVVLKGDRAYIISGMPDPQHINNDTFPDSILGEFYSSFGFPSS